MCKQMINIKLNCWCWMAKLATIKLFANRTINVSQEYLKPFNSMQKYESQQLI